MGKDPNLWVHWQHLPWQSKKLNCDREGIINPPPPNLGWHGANLAPFPGYTNPRGFINAGGNILPKLLQGSSSFSLPLDCPSNVPSSEAATAQKRFLIFDQSGDQTSLVFSSVGPPVWNLNAATNPNPKPKPIDSYGAHHTDLLPKDNGPVNWSDGANVSDGQGHDEMHEDTEEIDALLYSDSEAGEEDEDEDEASTGHSPAGPMGNNTEGVASSSIPTKRKRLDREEEGGDAAALVDTASSARACRVNCKDVGVGDISDESSCVRGGGSSSSSSSIGGGGAREDVPRANKRLKRERIQETVGVLRKIIPGGRGEDAVVVLDKAIRYLRSLKLKAKALGDDAL